MSEAPQNAIPDEEQWFQQALDLPPADRGRFLESLPDNGIRDQILSLLRAYEAAERNTAWEASALDAEARMVAADVAHGLDGYEILSQVGAGGMGTVYRAIRNDQGFSRTVALKIVHSAQPALLSRFYRERQIAGGLDHPNIARLLDVGATREGLPFLAMEFIEGVPVDRFVKENRLDCRTILALFRKICAAVSHAHRNLVIHRDLKPGNILVTPLGEPKLLDFGIAKLLDEEPRNQTAAAGMTLEYASPEQVAGGPVATASDVYSLGVLLYELLSGHRPYSETIGPVDLARVIATAPPEPLLGVEPDLALIVMMALRKEPERRYSSIDQFSDDIRRFLDGYPVLARPDSRSYRIKKFSWRHRVALAAAAVVATALLAGAASTIREQEIAERRFADLQQLAHSYLYEVYDGLRDLPGSMPLRQVVIKRALEYLDKLAKERSSRYDISRELAAAYQRVAQIQGAPGYPNLGDPRGALVSARKALGIRETLAHAHPDDVELASDLAQTEEFLGNVLLFQNDLQAANEFLRKAVSVSEKSAARHPGDFRASETLASNYMMLANVTGNNDFHNLGDWKGALSLYKKAEEIFVRLAREHPQDHDVNLSVTATYEKLAGMSRTQANDAEAAQYLQRAIAVGERFANANDSLFRRQVAVDSRSLCLSYLALKRVDEARPACDRANALFELAAKEDPQNVQAQEEVADSMWSQGFVLEKARKTDEALQTYERSSARYEELRAQHPGLSLNGRRSSYQLTAGLASRLGQLPRALAAANKELEIDDEALKKSPNDVSSKLNRGVALQQIGQAYQAVAMKTHNAADWRTALSWHRKSRDLWLEYKKEGILDPGYAGFLDRADKAIAKCREALGQ